MTDHTDHPVMRGMKNLLTPEGAAALKESIGPIELTQGALPFEDHKKATDKVEERPVGDRETKSKLDMPGQEVILFTLGPVYWTLKIPFDLVDQFLRSEYGVGAMTQRIGVSNAILPDVPGWEGIVEAINKEAWDNLVLFLSECVFTREANYWTLCGDFCSVQIKLGGKKKVMQAPVAVFTPRGGTVRMVPWVDDRGLIRLSQGPADGHVLQSDYSRKLNLIVDERS